MEREHGQLVGALGQVLGRDAPLRLEALGQVGIGIERDTVGPQRIDLGQRALEGLGRLLGQAVDQVHVDGGKAQLPCRCHQREHLLGRLHAVHGDLHLFVEVLHAEAQAVEAQLLEHGQAFDADGARIDLDGVFAARLQLEMLAQQGHQRAQLIVREEGGRAAAQVQLADGLALAAMGRVQGHLARQVVQVDGSAIVVARHDLVAGAVVAQRLAERHMHIQRQRHGSRCGTRFAVFKCQDIVFSTESLHETIGRGERGVSGPRYVEATQQLWGDSGHGFFL